MKRISLVVLAGLLLLPRGGLPADPGAPPALQAEDCRKCHEFQVRTMTESRGKHAQKVGCLECHPEHPPRGEKTVSACDTCHTQMPHYRLDDCLHCHVEPHRPLATLRDPLKPVRQECLSCHAAVGEQMAAKPGRHAELFCNRCHSRHKYLPGCLECHQPHLRDQSGDDCRICHPAHRPLDIVLNSYVPARFCRTCHVRQADDLASTPSRHKGINCVFCHKGRHASIPDCRDCHGLPHSQFVHSRFRGCLECHGDAHNLVSNR